MLFDADIHEIIEAITPRTKLIIVNFPSNPTGGVASRAQLEGIARVINEKCQKDVRVFTDEIYEYFVYDGRKHESCYSHRGRASGAHRRRARQRRLF